MQYLREKGGGTGALIRATGFLYGLSTSGMAVKRLELTRLFNVLGSSCHVL